MCLQCILGSFCYHSKQAFGLVLFIQVRALSKSRVRVIGLPVDDPTWLLLVHDQIRNCWCQVFPVCSSLKEDDNPKDNIVVTVDSFIFVVAASFAVHIIRGIEWPLKIS